MASAAGRASPIHSGEDLVQRFQRSWQLQVGQLGRDAFPARERLHCRSPVIRAYAARGRCSTSTTGGTAAARVRRAPCGSGLGATGQYGQGVKGVKCGHSRWKRSEGRSFSVPWTRTLASRATAAPGR